MAVDPLLVLREYRRFAPWNVRDLTATAGHILRRSRVRPVSPSAAVAPGERTIRFYVTRGLLSPPEGRGAAANYSYRHLLQLLTVKLRQMEGATLTAIVRELGEATGDVLERRVAAALGERLPPPAEAPAGAGRAFHGGADNPLPGAAADRATWRRVAVAPGLELHVNATHPLADARLAEALASEVRAALARVRPDRPDR